MIFDDEETYEKVKKTGLLNKAAMAKFYHIDENDVVASLFWDQAMAYKDTTVRHVISGSFC